MEFMLDSLLKWVESHLGIGAMGLAGATVAFLLSPDPVRDKLIGFAVGIILCLALSNWTAEIFAKGGHPEVFGFFWGIIGKSTAEILLNKLRKKAEEKVDSL